MDLNIQETLERADNLYAARERKEKVLASVALLRAASYEEFAAAWRLARAYFFLGQETGQRREAREFHVRGAKAGRRAVRFAPTRVEGHFWFGVNLALRAQVESAWYALPLALRARRALRRAVELDAAYHGAGPLRVLARLEQKLPRWAGGGRERARRNFERAVRLSPQNTVTRLYFAEMLLEEKRLAEAHAQLEALLEAQPEPAWAFEAARDRARAREILESLTREQGEKGE